MFYKTTTIFKGLRAFAAISLVFLVSITASAYTIVMRDGRRVSIPDDFAVSNVTLTYEAGDHIQVTLQLAAIDIAATERANNQPPGTFLKRAQRRSTVRQPVVQTKGTQRSVTNRDLHKFRTARLENEAAYEEKRKELGLPSLEEMRKQAQARAELTAEISSTLRAREYESESYWRTRASALRSELAATNAQIDFVRARLNELPTNSPFGIVATALPFGTFSHSVVATSVGPISRRPLMFGRGSGHVRPPTFLHPGLGGTQIGGRVHFGGGRTHARIGINANHFRLRSSHSSLRFAPIVAIPFQDVSYERSALITQLDELLADRAGLQSRWRDLEEEARRAGAYPGWLRP
jgi:hypothetical protein